MLHGVTMLQVDATPICDFEKSSGVNPTACSIARLAARSGPSTTIEEKARLAGWPLCVALRAGLAAVVFIKSRQIVTQRSKAGKRDAASPALAASPSVKRQIRSNVFRRLSQC